MCCQIATHSLNGFEFTPLQSELQIDYCIQILMYSVSPLHISSSGRNAAYTQTDTHTGTREFSHNLLHCFGQYCGIDVLVRFLTAALISSIFQCGYTPFLMACEYQKIEIVQYLAEIAEVNISVCCEGGMTGLHLAAIHDSLEIARFLMKKGCPIDALDEAVNNTEYVYHVASSVSSMVFPSLSIP